MYCDTVQWCILLHLHYTSVSRVARAILFIIYLILYINNGISPESQTQLYVVIFVNRF